MFKGSSKTYVSMLEVQTHPNDYMVESIYPYSIDTPEIITKTNRELTRNATLLIRTIQLLRNDGSLITNMNHNFERLTKTILNNLLLFKTRLKINREEYEVIKAELKNAELDREALHVQRRIGEIVDAEYSLKLSVADWTVSDLAIHRDDLKKSIKAMDELKDNILSFKDVNELYQISKNNYKAINYLELLPHTKEKLIYTLSKLLEIITSSNQSTI